MVYAVVRQTLQFGLEVAWIRPPAIFPPTKGDFGSEPEAVVQTFVAKADSGRDQFAWARIGSAAGAAGITNIWQPSLLQA